MPEFLDLVDVATALQRIFMADLETGGAEWINVADASGRVTSHSIDAEENLPRFNRSTVDGYTVRASDTFGACDSLPVYLRLVGEIEMGMEPLMTGSMRSGGHRARRSWRIGSRKAADYLVMARIRDRALDDLIATFPEITGMSSG